MTENAAVEQLLYQHLGEEALTYLLNLGPGQIARFQGEPSQALLDPQETVLAQLLILDAQLNAMEQHDDLIARNWRTTLSTRHDQLEMSTGNVAYYASGGEAPGNANGNTPELLLRRLTVEVFPALLVKEPDGPFAVISRFSLYNHPSDTEFQAIVRADEQLGAMFSEDSPSSGHGGTTLRSTGSGGSHQLSTFAETIIGSGWRLARSRSVHPTLNQTISAVIESLAAVRAGIHERDTTVPALVGLTGVLLPDDIDELVFPWGRIRKADERDQLFSRSTNLNGQLTTSTPEGETVIINYSGDLVLEVAVPYIVQIQAQSTDPMFPWPDELQVGFKTLDEHVENVRLGLLLALPERKPVIAPSWQVMFDPMNQGVNTGWSDVKRVPGLMPVQLTNAQAEEWKSWAERVAEKRVPTISVALRRMLAAAAERNTPDDVLVDAVIVWENLFGAKTETTLRVTSSLAWILGSSAADRRSRQTRYKKIYAARSDVVHGSATVRPQQIQEYSVEAVSISIDALRALFTTHASLLDVAKSEDRSIRILHEG